METISVTIKRENSEHVFTCARENLGGCVERADAISAMHRRIRAETDESARQELAQTVFVAQCELAGITPKIEE